MLLLLLTIACSPVLNFQVSKIGDEPEEYQQRIIYSLPQNLLRINFVIEKESYIPGPYNAFANRFLGIENVIEEYGFQYRIESVDIESLKEPDPELFYSLNVLKGSLDWNKYLNLSDRGLVINPLVVNHSGVGIQNNESVSDMGFKNLSLKMNLTEIKDTLYKTIITDTMLIRLPVVTTARDVRTLDQKAEEAATNLFQIRENRFYTITNIDGDYPDGKAMDVMVKEMDKMEKSYIELFTGKVVKQKFTRSFVVVPTASRELQKIELASFSTSKGLLKSDEAYKLVLQIIPENNLSVLRNLPDQQSDGKSFNKLYYRVPDIAKVEIKLEEEEIYENRILIYQLGSIVAIPVSE